MKKVISILLVMTLLIGMVTLSAGAALSIADLAEESFTPDPNKLYFDARSTGWEIGAKDKIGFYISSDEEGEEIPWDGKKLLGTQVSEQEGLWEYDPAAKGMTLNEGVQYKIVFCRAVNGRATEYTYELFMDINCFGCCAYCDGTDYEDPSDASRTLKAAFWKEQDATAYGPVLRITSTGKVVGSCYPQGDDAESTFGDFISDADKVEDVRLFSGKSDQEIVDDICEALGLTKQQAYDILSASGSDLDWDYQVSSLPGDVVIPTEAPTETYILGDTNGDGEITIMDATVVQRMLADLSVTVDDPAKARIRAAATDPDNGMGILDATAIQRLLVGYSNTYHLGTVKTYS